MNARKLVFFDRKYTAVVTLQKYWRGLTTVSQATVKNSSKTTLPRNINFMEDCLAMTTLHPHSILGRQVYLYTAEDLEGAHVSPG